MNNSQKINSINSQLDFPGIYLHIPFCVSRCSYCDFFSSTKLSLRDEFAIALAKEIELFSKNSEYKKEIDTIYFGGGTPSLLNPQQMNIIFEQIHKTFNVRKNSEITLEANPGTIDLKYISDYQTMGVNRISFGVQSFDDEELKFLNRIHTANEAIDSYKQIRNLGFSNVSLDLIFGIPGQNYNSWMKNLEVTKSLAPEHISTYNLIYEKGTKLQKELNLGKFSQLDESLEEELYYLTSDFFISNNYEHYEISNFAKEGFKSRHNSKYWKHIVYYGFGPSAHSFSGEVRYWNYSHFKHYFDKLKANELPIESQEILSKKELFTEKLMLSLRSEGLDNELFRSEFGIDVKELLINKLEKFNKYFDHKDNIIRLNSKGYFVINEILVSLINSE